MTETETVMMPRSLTAENGAKKLMTGEFKETVEAPCTSCLGLGCNSLLDDCDICKGTGLILYDADISWTTIKSIYAKVVKEFGK